MMITKKLRKRKHQELISKEVEEDPVRVDAKKLTWKMMNQHNPNNRLVVALEEVGVEEVGRDFLMTMMMKKDKTVHQEIRALV